MVSKDYAILPSVLVFVLVIRVYRLITYYASKSERFERLIEGDPLYFIEDRKFVLVKRSEHNFAKDEFFAELRGQGISHMGQVETAILETNGRLSVFFYNDENVKPGLSVMPKLYAKKSSTIVKPGLYACTYCGACENLETSSRCGRCNKQEWVPAVEHQRVA